MDLDDFITGKKGNDTGYENEFNRTRELFNASIKKQRAKAIAFSAILVVLTGLYLASLRNGAGPVKLGASFIAVGFISGALYLYSKNRSLPRSIYTLPASEFVKTARRKLEYFRAYDYVIIIPILILLGIGGGLIFVSRLLNYTDKLNLLIVIWVLFFIGIVIFGFYAGKKNWQKEHGGLLKEVEKLDEYFREG